MDRRIPLLDLPPLARSHRPALGAGVAEPRLCGLFPVRASRRAGWPFAFAGKILDGMRASGPLVAQANTCSMTTWPPCRPSPRYPAGRPGSYMGYLISWNLKNQQLSFSQFRDTFYIEAPLSDYQRRTWLRTVIGTGQLHELGLLQPASTTGTGGCAAVSGMINCLWLHAREWLMPRMRVTIWQTWHVQLCEPRWRPL